ncbi:MAG: class D beta-lactamase [Candidatus Wallbacteria bacterium]|nr:class D beta-lactamase [Candidatus Wallbacteria bacterium]
MKVVGFVGSPAMAGKLIVIMALVATVVLAGEVVDCSRDFNQKPGTFQCERVSLHPDFLPFIGKWEGEFMSYDNDKKKFRPVHNVVDYSDEDCYRDPKTGDIFLIGREINTFLPFMGKPAMIQSSNLVYGLREGLEDKPYLLTVDHEHGICEYKLVSEDNTAEIAVWKTTIPASSGNLEMEFTVTDARDHSYTKATRRNVKVELRVGSSERPLWEGVVTKGFHTRAEEQLGKYFKGYDGCFVLYDMKSGQYTFYNYHRCETRFSPCSTFKVFNSLAGLDAGILNDENTLFKWDGTKQPYGSWEKEQTLQSAFRDSVVWYFQENSRRVGPLKMQKYLNGVGYGNCDISGGIDTFWLNSTLKVSAIEQVIFLKRLYRDKLPFEQRSMETVRKIMVQEQEKNLEFSGKTGSAFVNDKWTLGWFVGHLKLKTSDYLFAANISAPDDARGTKAREITCDILKELFGVKLTDK